MAKKNDKLTRSKANRIVAGVCGGLGRYFNIDPTLLRLLFLLSTLTGGVGVLIYIILAIIIPERSEKKGDKEESLRNFVDDLGKKIQNLAKELKLNKKFLSDSRNIVGVLIILIGVSLLIQQFLPLNLFNWDFLWPTAIVVVGFYVIIKNKDKK